MDIAIFIAQIVILFGIVLLSCYFKEKGKNIATKEDIGKITAEIEKVKHEYSSKLESVKSILSARLFTHQVRYQNEFDMLVSLSKKATKFKMVMDDVDTSLCRRDKSEIIRQKIVIAFTAMGVLMAEYEAYKPFYPQRIYDSLTELHELAWVNITLQAENRNLIDRTEVSQFILDQLKENKSIQDAETMSEVLEKLRKAIRERVEYWEHLNIE